MFSISVPRFQKSDDKMLIMIIIMMMIFIIMIIISMIFNIYISYIRWAAKETALRTSLLLFQSNGVFMWVRVHCCCQSQNDESVYQKQMMLSENDSHKGETNEHQVWFPSYIILIEGEVCWGGTRGYKGDWPSIHNNCWGCFLFVFLFVFCFCFFRGGLNSASYIISSCN